MKVIKYLIALIVVSLLLFAFVHFFSIVESRFQCSGEISSKSGSRPMITYMKLAKYRWWVHLWNDSYGFLWLEIPTELYDYYQHIDEVGDQLQIFDSYPQKKLKGNFSILSKTLSISTPDGFFDGTCKRID